MPDWIVAHEPWLRAGSFGAILLALLLLEEALPRRAGPMRRRLRWGANLPMVVIDVLLARLVVPLGATGAAIWADVQGLGLFALVAWPGWLEGTLAFLALDCLIYWQHRIFHQWPLAWRLHRMHHSDIEFDATTALRFHPLEIIVSLFIKIGAVLALGAPALAVVLFEIALNGVAMFNHANLRLPPALDRALRTFVVTPDMHRVHHSTHRREHDSNYGFNLPWWDWLFRSYTAQPHEGHEAMRIGLEAFRDDADQKLLPLLLQPRVSPRR